ncbi:MAG: Ig-like domain-containing protein, partial [bacterium]|nr:Ig-like domain-containing protein [bacterium]
MYNKLMHRLWLKRIFFGLAAMSSLVLLFVFLPYSVLAQTTDLTQVGVGGDLPTDDIRIIIARIVRAVIAFLGIVFFSLVVYGGILYMTARGDSTKTKKATDVIRDAVIGLAIVLSSYAIATFVLNALLRAAGIGGGVISDNVSFIEPLGGALGNGIIQDHYPPRNGFDVPRNTKVIITFKEPIDLDSLIAAGTINPTDPFPVGKVNADNVKIYRSDDGVSAALAQADVDVTFTADKLIFVFDPVPLLGSPLENQNYSVFLSPAIQKLQPDLTLVAAFPPPNDSGYLWGFQVSTVVDVTPPQVQSFVPNAGGTFDKNILVQVNFNEAVDPTAATGVFQPSSDPLLDFDNIQVQNITAGGVSVEGTYIISNGYRTVEFVTFDQCGQNACGGAIYCLPGDADINTLVRTPGLGLEPPQAQFTSSGYLGIVDVAGNAFDGGGQYGLLSDFVAQGPPSPVNSLAIDNYWTDFATNNFVNTTRPRITNILPTQNQSDVDVASPIEITFGNVAMRMSSLTNSNMGLTPEPFHELWYVGRGENILGTPVPPSTTPPVTGTTAIIQHGVLLDYLEGDPTQDYYPIVNNEVE